MSLSNRIRPNSEAAPWVVDEVKKLEEKLIWLVRHAIFTSSISRAKGAEILGVSLIDLDEVLVNKNPHTGSSFDEFIEKEGLDINEKK